MVMVCPAVSVALVIVFSLLVLYLYCTLARVTTLFPIFFEEK
jgi:hypothetical protein